MRLDDDYLRELELAAIFALQRARDGVTAPVVATLHLAKPAPVIAVPRPAVVAPLRVAKPAVAPLTIDPARATHIAALTWEYFASDVAQCKACELCGTRKQSVPGAGALDATWFFVGEGPGAEEDESGEPFVGLAGALLEQMLGATGLKRGREVYIANVVKCRPPANRTPLPNEVAACRQFLDGQIDAIRPKVIVALGKPATSLLLGRDIAISRVRGSWHDYRGFPVMPTYHPAFLLRQYTPENRRLVWEDLKAALERSQAAH